MNVSTTALNRWFDEVQKAAQAATPIKQQLATDPMALALKDPDFMERIVRAQANADLLTYLRSNFQYIRLVRSGSVLGAAVAGEHFVEQLVAGWDSMFNTILDEHVRQHGPLSTNAARRLANEYEDELDRAMCFMADSLSIGYELEERYG